MKRVIVFILFFISTACFAKSERKALPVLVSPIDTILSQILALPLQSYIGKPVDSLFAVLPGSYTDRGFKPMGIGYARGVVQGYGTGQNSCFVEIFIDTFQHMTFPNRTPTTNWNMNLAKLETIAYIKVWKNNVCMYGCNNPNYY